jgi:hypothetical protein
MGSAGLCTTTAGATPVATSFDLTSIQIMATIDYVMKGRKRVSCVVLEDPKGTMRHDARLGFTASLSELTSPRRSDVKKGVTAARLVSRTSQVDSTCLHHSQLAVQG